MNLRKLLTSAVFVLGACMSAGVAQAQYGDYQTSPLQDAANDCPVGCPGSSTVYTWATTTDPGLGGYSALVNITVGGTNYNYTVYAINGAYTDSAFTSAYLTNTPWFTGNSTLALPFAAAAGTQLGYSIHAPSTVGALFAYAAPSGSYSTVPSAFYMSSTPMSAPAGSGAPEIDGSLAPKVGFLLGCLFLMFGRKKQDTEPMLTA